MGGGGGVDDGGHVALLERHKRSQPFLDLAPGGWMEESCDQLCFCLSQAEQDRQTASRRVRRATAAGDGRSAARAL
jgi:hypothetical protein